MSGNYDIGRREIEFKLKPLDRLTSGDNPYRWSIRQTGSVVQHGFADTPFQALLTFIRQRFDAPTRCHCCGGQFDLYLREQFCPSIERWGLSCGCEPPNNLDGFAQFERTAKDQPWTLHSFSYGD